MDHAKWQVTQDVTYDGSYRQISYPNGDVPANIGVCTDVIIRSFRGNLFSDAIIISDFPGAFGFEGVNATLEFSRMRRGNQCAQTNHA